MGRLLDALLAESERRCDAATLATTGKSLSYREEKVADVAESQRSPVEVHQSPQMALETSLDLDAAPHPLLVALRTEGLPNEWLSSDPDTLADTSELSTDALRTYVRARADSLLRESGRCIADETTPARCQFCGPVWIPSEIAVMAPKIAGWPRVLGCPWCHVRNRDAIPRPLQPSLDWLGEGEI